MPEKNHFSNCCTFVLSRLASRLRVQASDATGQVLCLPRYGVAFLWLFSLAGTSLAQNDAWHVEDATLRFKVSLSSQPSRTSAGYIVKLPDGGILPKPKPGTIVMDENGRELKHGCLWHDSGKALAIVFEAPASESVYVYAKSASSLNVWTPASGLTPSMILYVKPGVGNMDAARQLANRFPPGKDVYFDQLSDISLGGDPTGCGGIFSTYILGYLASEDPGRTWIALQGDNGVEVMIDGQKLNPTKQFDKSCGTGQWLDISKDLLKIDVFHFFGGDRRGYVRVAWKTPHTTISELGGPRGKGLPGEGTSMWAARPIRPSECVHSGKANVVAAYHHDGSPVPIFSVHPQEYFWFAERPVILYEFNAKTSGNPKDTTYKWNFGNNLQLTGQEKATWLLEGHQEHQVSMITSLGNKHTMCTYTIYGFCPGRRKSDINCATTRSIYHNAFLNMFHACPLDKDPTAAWSNSMWDLFFRLMEPGSGKALLAHIFTKRWEMLKSKLSEQNRWQLEDLFFAFACPMNPQQATKWLDKFEKEEKDAERRQHWQLKRVELLMYYMDDLEQAKKLANYIVSRSSSSLRTRIRLGDIAFLKGDYNEATRMYGQVQNRVKHRKKAAGKKELLENRLHSGLARSKAEVKKKLSPQTGSLMQRTHERIADWRIGAIRETSVSETTRNLIQQGYYLEAKQLLDEWEMEFPLSKISGDYIVVEAKLLMEAGDFIRPARILSAYCKAVDITNYLPEAMQKALYCMMKAGEPDEKLEEFVMEMKKRFKYHPIGDDAQTMLKLLKADTVKREVTKDTL